MFFLAIMFKNIKFPTTKSYYFSLISANRKYSSHSNMVHFLIDEKDPKQSALQAPYIKLYTSPTPNGLKVTTLLELLNLNYHVRNINIMKNEQKEDWYESFNLNGRIPSLTHVDEKGDVHHINESAAIMIYLCDKFDKERKFSYGPESSHYYESLEWIFWQMAGLGPMAGQANHFKLFAPVKIEYGITRYVNETKRLYSVFEKKLEQTNTGFIVGDHISIADLVSYPWISKSRLEIDLSEYPRIAQWVSRLGSIDAIAKGMNIPDHFAT